MCARRFLAVIFVLTLVVVAGAFAVFQWGGNVLLESATPRGHFEAPVGGGAPVYADADLWVARPGMRNNPALWRPDGLQGIAESGGAAVFYIHPTTYLDRDRWNASFRADSQTEFRTRLFVQSQASAFNGVGEIWAPRYRQAAYGAFLLKSTDAQKALSLAYMDVEAAFAEFLKEVPSDTPIILAGHSQGALHLARLLAQHRSDIGGRLVAAYVVGWPLSTTADLPSLRYPACATADQSGCILSWMSFGDPANPDLILDQWRKTEGPTGLNRRREDILCVNPLTGTAGGAAPPEANLGTVVPSANLLSARLEPGRVGAHCDKGLLLLEGEIPPLGPYVLPGNNYHVYDYALFWGSIRRDAERRLATWQR
ncbi:MAG: DUF3089 domain-containing protein [Sphingomicrobium sp.]